tara:strand:- start:1891 stop:2175 length:285 start_codon:yes stop_codon:yes gene_type:complete
MKVKKEEGKKALVCSCGYKKKDAGHIEIKERVQKKKEVEVVDEEEKQLPKTKAECQKCKHKEAFFWLVQTRGGDEPETKFLKCTKCKHTWRDYS